MGNKFILRGTKDLFEFETYNGHKVRTRQVESEVFH